MQCGEFRILLNDWLDGFEPELDVEAAAHARECADCGELLAANEMLLAGLLASPLPEPSAGFSARVVAEVTSRPAHAASSFWSRAASTATWAAPLAAAVLIGAISFLRSGFVGPGQDQMAKAPQDAAAPQVAAETNSRRFSFLREAVWSGLDRVGQDPHFTPPAWVAQMSDELKPLPRSVGTVLLSQPLTSPVGAALIALDSPVPGA